MSDAPSKDELLSMAEFVTAFESADFVAGEWISAVMCPDGIMQVGRWSPSDCVMRWEQAIYDRHLVDPDSDYLSGQFSMRMQSYMRDSSLVMEADLDVVRTVLTNIVRGDRFCDGYMADMFETGVAQAATRRLVELADW